jgi:hypothetical protein
MFRMYGIIAFAVVGLYTTVQASTHSMTQGPHYPAGAPLFAAASSMKPQELRRTTSGIKRATGKGCPKDHTPCGPANDQFCCNNATTDCINGACHVKQGVFDSSPAQTAPSSGR